MGPNTHKVVIAFGLNRLRNSCQIMLPPFLSLQGQIRRRLLPYSLRWPCRKQRQCFRPGCESQASGAENTFDELLDEDPQPFFEFQFTTTTLQASIAGGPAGVYPRFSPLPDQNWGRCMQPL